MFPQAQIIAQSEGDADDELLSVAVVKGGKKVVVGSTSGVLNIWSWGYWNDCSDRFPGWWVGGRGAGVEARSRGTLSASLPPLAPPLCSPACVC